MMTDTDYLTTHWPTLDSIPDGRDLFAQYPVFGTERKTCYQCKGYGKALGPNGEWETCPRCGGTGTE